MKKVLFLSAFVATLFFTNCHKETPAACISTDTPTTGKVGVSLTFKSCSTGAHHDEWDFGDAATAIGTTATHAYSKAGTFTVKITSLTADKSKSNSKSQTITITP